MASLYQWSELISGWIKWIFENARYVVPVMVLILGGAGYGIFGGDDDIEVQQKTNIAKSVPVENKVKPATVTKIIKTKVIERVIDKEVIIEMNKRIDEFEIKVDNLEKRVVEFEKHVKDYEKHKKYFH